MKLFDVYKAIRLLLLVSVIISGMFLCNYYYDIYVL